MPWPVHEMERSGMYLPMYSADGMCAACRRSCGGLISSSRQLVHVPNNICKLGLCHPQATAVPRVDYGSAGSVLKHVPNVAILGL